MGPTAVPIRFAANAPNSTKAPRAALGFVSHERLLTSVGTSVDQNGFVSHERLLTSIGTSVDQNGFVSHERLVTSIGTSVDQNGFVSHERPVTSIGTSVDQNGFVRSISRCPLIAKTRFRLSLLTIAGRARLPLP
jgi:hypothetical protein